MVPIPKTPPLDVRLVIKFDESGEKGWTVVGVVLVAVTTFCGFVVMGGTMGTTPEPMVNAVALPEAELKYN